MIQINNIYNNEISKSTNQIRRLDIQEISIDKINKVTVSKNNIKTNNDGKVLKKEDVRFKNYIKRNGSSFDKYA